MRIERHTDAAAYERLVTPLLLADEPRYNLEVGVAHRIANGDAFGDDPPLLLTLGDGPDGAAMMTPPYNLLVSGVPTDAAAELAEYVVAHGIEPPGAMGTTATVTAFAERYAALTGCVPRTRRASGVYALRAVIPPRPTTGALRQATEADRDLVVAWVRAFQVEAGLDPLPEGQAERRLRGGFSWLWDDGGPVSLCGCGGTTPNGARIGPVYTPPEHRGRGYASAATAGVTRLLLDRGLAMTFLYTDLANPTSNKIYRAIGYEHVTDVHEVAFDR